MIISHLPPDYPVMSLKVAERGRDVHANCDPETCSAKPYYDKLVTRLERESRTSRASHNSSSLRGAWNIW